MYKYQFENLKVRDLQEAETKIQNFIDFNQYSLLARHIKTLINENGTIKHVSVPEKIIGDTLLPEGVGASNIVDEFAHYLTPISLQAKNYLAMNICHAINEDAFYENLRMIFYDPEDIAETSFLNTDMEFYEYSDDYEYKEIKGCCVIENQMFGLCSVEQLFMQVMIGLKINAEDEIVEIVYMHSSIMGA